MNSFVSFIEFQSYPVGLGWDLGWIHRNLKWRQSRDEGKKSLSDAWAAAFEDPKHIFDDGKILRFYYNKNSIR